MKMLETIGLRALRSFDPETAHGLAIKALNLGLGPRVGAVTSPRLTSTIAGLSFPNPVGLAAGFDKNAQALGPLQKAGFGFLEVGAATPRPQPGNPKPRLFRLSEDQAAINRFGFNNDGMDAIADRLGSRPIYGTVGLPIGLNLGANKDSDDRAADFATVLGKCCHVVDFATVNVSSPNTEKLRDLQGKDALAALLGGVQDANATGIPIFLKIAPDLSDADLQDVADVVNASSIAGVITTNTTLDRTGLASAQRDEAGGLSGQPLFEKSTRVLAKMSTLTDLPLIGVGGVGSADQAYAKIRAGASAVQLYTALVYGGISLAADIARGLDALLERDGFANVADAVGTGKEDWL
ncbi:Dihydroorotate dehydrogenase (quinone) [Nymphon striatum]|nr:Dihydroorotate dehydrogenase (quinone) [Nymphon striatum]